MAHSFLPLGDTLSRICHYLQWDDLIRLACTDKATHRRIYPDHPNADITSSCHHAAAAAAPTSCRAMDCWGALPTVAISLCYTQRNNATVRDVRLARIIQVNGRALLPLSQACLGERLPPRASDAQLSVQALIEPSIAFPPLPPLLSLMRCLRFVHRLSYEHRGAVMSVFVTIMSILPAFPRLQHFSLYFGQGGDGYGVMSVPQDKREAAFTARSCVINALFSCLLQLPALTSLYLDGWIPTMRRHPERTGGGDSQYVIESLNKLLARQVRFAHLPGIVLQTMMKAQSEPWRLQLLEMRGSQVPLIKLLLTCPSLFLLDCGPMTDRVSSDFTSSLRYLHTRCGILGLHEIASISSYIFLHSLHIKVSIQVSGMAGLAPLSALCNLHPLQQLTLELISNSKERQDLDAVTEEELFDLTWLDSLHHLTYLQLCCPQHINIKTLQSIHILPHHRSPPLFIRRLESFGIFIWIQKVKAESASDFNFDSWVELKSACVRYVQLCEYGFSFSGVELSETVECEAATAVVEEKLGVHRCVSEQQLVALRLDQMWKREHDVAEETFNIEPLWPWSRTLVYSQCRRSL